MSTLNKPTNQKENKMTNLSDLIRAGRLDEATRLVAGGQINEADDENVKQIRDLSKRLGVQLYTDVLFGARNQVKRVVTKYGTARIQMNKNFDCSVELQFGKGRGLSDGESVLVNLSILTIKGTSAEDAIKNAIRKIEDTFDSLRGLMATTESESKKIYSA